MENELMHRFHYRIVSLCIKWWRGGDDANQLKAISASVFLHFDAYALHRGVFIS